MISSARRMLNRKRGTLFEAFVTLIQHYILYIFQQNFLIRKELQEGDRRRDEDVEAWTFFVLNLLLFLSSDLGQALEDDIASFAQLLQDFKYLGR